MGSQPTKQGPPPEFSVLTFNVWFANVSWKHRADILFKLVEVHQPTIICFQEVTREFQEYAATQEVMQQYVMDQHRIASYGVAIGYRKNSYLSEAKVEFDEFRLLSNMDRTLKTIKVTLNGHTLHCGTVHLESLSTRDTRKNQLKQIQAYYKKKRGENVVFCGDFNFDSVQNWNPNDGLSLENTVLKEEVPDYTDVWASLKPTERGLTFDTETNPWIGGKRREQMRYDRMMVRSAVWDASSIEIIGNNVSQFHDPDYEGLDDRLPSVPSDHYGLFAKFTPKADEAPPST